MKNIEHSFCDGNFTLTDKEKLMYRIYGKLMKKIRLAKLKKKDK
jgi:hypothetical protein